MAEIEADKDLPKNLAALLSIVEAASNMVPVSRAKVVDCLGNPAEEREAVIKLTDLWTTMNQGVIAILYATVPGFKNLNEADKTQLLDSIFIPLSRLAEGLYPLYNLLGHPPPKSMVEMSSGRAQTVLYAMKQLDKVLEFMSSLTERQMSYVSLSKLTAAAARGEKFQLENLLKERKRAHGAK